MSPPREAPGAEWPALLLAVTLAPALHHLRYGYRFGFSDQDEILPWLVARLEPELFRSDWLVGTQSGAFNVRSGMVSLLEPLARLASPEAAVLVIHVASWVLLSAAVFGLARRITVHPFPALVATVLVLFVLGRWTLGSDSMASPMLVPTLTAWAIALPAIALVDRGRPVLAGVLVAGAAWVQILVAFHVGLAALAAGLVRGRPRESVRFALPALALALPTALLLADSASAGPPTESEPTVFALIAHFRAPHHYAPGAFATADWIRVALLFATGVPALLATRGFRPAASTRYYLGIVSVAVFMFLVGWWGASVRHDTIVTMAQPFRQSVLAGVVLTAAVTGAAWDLAGSAARRTVGAWLRPRPALFVAGVAVVASVTWLPVVQRPAESLPEVAAWARTSTPADALFAVPPSTTGFRWLSRRSVLVTFKAWAFTERHMRAWLRRLGDVAPGAAVVPGTLRPDPDVGPLIARLDSAWESLDVDALHSLAARYGVTHAVRRTPLASGAPAPVATPGGLFVYALRGASVPVADSAYGSVGIP